MIDWTEVGNSSQRDFGFGLIVTKEVEEDGIRAMSVIEARCVDKEAYVFELLAFYTD
jgi:hypothetical protein